MRSHFSHGLSASVLLVFAVACGSKTFVQSESGGAGGDSGATGGGSGSGGSGAAGGSGGGTGGSTGGRGGTGGGTGGSITTGGSGGTAGSGTGGGAGEGAGGTGGSLSGAGGDAGSGAGVGGSTAGAGGCGPCPGVACGPPFVVAVSAESGSDIADLKASADFPITCYANGGSPCQWTCQSDDFELPDGDYTVVLSAPGFESKSIDFSIVPQTNCGCCGCPCPLGYYGNEVLTGTGGEACCADRHIDPNNCGACGNACGSGVCTAGQCEGGSDCATITTRDECEASSQCHSVFVDPGTCGCASVGCCAKFSRCANGDLADCKGANVSCEIVTPFCEEPAYVVSYTGSCYEGCVDPKDCAE